jgi:DUF438 domain-containing protein
MNEFEWAEGLNCAVTIADKECNIVFMNKVARDTFAKHGNLIGKNLMDCHPQHAQETIRRLLATGESNSYTIEKRGVHKMIYQTPWRIDGEIAGLVEISMVIPANLPHYVRE